MTFLDQNKIVIAGIGTDVGKTIVSAILCERLNADYWKPVQAGNLNHSDRLKVQQLVGNKTTKCWPEAYCLKKPMSPHAAAASDGLNIQLNKLQVPKTKNKIVIELAGGIMVPLNNNYLNLDLIRRWQNPVVLVSQNYLGSINHTLLSVEVLKANGIHILGIVFCGKRNLQSESIILRKSKLPCIGKIPILKNINRKSISRISKTIQLNSLV